MNCPHCHTAINEVFGAGLQKLKTESQGNNIVTEKVRKALQTITSNDYLRKLK
jgi:hypothetical protein